ncbi:AMP-binding protein [Halomicrobium salinisoli]|uniref:AMP-binding protein n=1 Tax=Halomicrobium salinisoli TaxID=2878391 RepID=UPI001CEFCC03|nr:AMP-binding protein [Halomicrobium salinisoli]
MSEHGPQRWVGNWSGRRAALTPGGVGLVDAATGAEYTYADLDRRANRTARLLAEYGVRAGGSGESGESPRGESAAADEEPGSVTVIARNRPEYVDLFFGTGKTGGVLAPLSYRLAPPELAALLDDVDPSLLVVEEPFADGVVEALELADVDPPALSLTTNAVATWEPYGDALPDEDAAYDGPELAPSDPHLLLHTGGSTGTPKETEICHEAIAWNSMNTITSWGLRPDDVTPMVFPMFHTGGWNVLTLPVFHMGGTVVIDREFEPGEVLGLIEERDATVLVAVPAVLRAMTEHDRWAETDLSSLRFAKSGGGPCREAVMQAWWDRGVDLSQGYGLTECGPNNFAMPEGWDRGKADTVGVPAMHVDARVVDEGRELDPGAVGELELRSPHSATCYRGRDEETAATFGDEAAAADGPRTGGAWLSTGDLARIDEDGYVSVQGRKSDMFVSGGENVYPAEVEDAVADHPAVGEVVVIPVDDEQWGRVGKAVIEPTADPDAAPPSADDLAAFLDGRLAGYKRPRHVAVVDELPKSGPAKVDREAVQRAFGD